MDYSKGKIYIIKNNANDLCYVGSTCQSIENRFCKHKSCVNTLSKNHYPLYQAMRDLGKQSFYVELVEDYPCNSKQELNAREGHWIRQLNTYNNGYNRRIEKRTDKERYQDVKDTEEFKDKQRNYVERNKEAIKQYKAEWHEKNKDREEYKAKKRDSDANFRKNNPEKIKQYKENSKNKDIEKFKELKAAHDRTYRETHKEVIALRKKEYYYKCKEAKVCLKLFCELPFNI